jgi:hypothetical protein
MTNGVVYWQNCATFSYAYAMCGWVEECPNDYAFASFSIVDIFSVSLAVVRMSDLVPNGVVVECKGKVGVGMAGLRCWSNCQCVCRVLCSVDKGRCLNYSVVGQTLLA